MAEYKGAILRNGLLAAIGIILIVGIALFGSTVLTQFQSSSTITNSNGSGTTTVATSNHVSVPAKTAKISSSQSLSTSQPSPSSSTIAPSSISASHSSNLSASSSSASTSQTSSPETQFTPPGTIAEIAFGAAAFAYDNYTDTIYAASQGGQSAILEINASTNEVIGQLMLPDGSSATSVVFNPNNQELYYSFNGSTGSSEASLASVIAIDTRTNGIVANLSGINARALAVDPLHDRVFASELLFFNNTYYLTVAVIDGRTNTVTANLTLFEMYSGVEGCCYLGPLMYNPISGYLYESSGAYGADGGFGPFQLTYNTLGGTNAVGNLSEFPSYGTANYAYNPTNGLTYVANGGYISSMGAYNPPYVVPGDNITVLSATRSVSTITVEDSSKNGSVGDIVYDPIHQNIIIANGTLNLKTYAFADDDLTLINTGTQTITRVIPIQNNGIDCLLYDVANGDIYVATPSTIFVISGE